MPRMDAHVHLHRRATPAYPRAVMDIFPADAELTAETFLQLMDGHGVDRAVLVSLDHEPRYLLECLAAHPDRFDGIGVVDPGDPDPASTFRWLHAGGVSGMRIGRLAQPEDETLGHRERALLEALEAEGGVLWFYGPSDQIPAIRAAATAFPGLPIVLNHLAFFPGGFGVDADGNRTIETALPPATLEPVRALAAAHPSLGVVISGQYAFSREAFPHDDLASTTRAVVEAFGPGRAMWGSDHPASGPSADYASLLSLPERHLPDLDDQGLAAIMGGTAAALFGGRW